MYGHKAFMEKYAHETSIARTLNNNHYPDHMGRFPWEISTTISKKKLGDLMYNLHLKGGCISSSFTLGTPNTPEQARGYGVWFIVWVKPQYIAELDPNFKPAGFPHLN